MINNHPRVRLIQPPPPDAGASSSRPDAALDRSALGLLRHQHGEEQQREGDGEVFLLQSVYRKIMDHLSSDTSRELGGLLLGTEIRPEVGRAVILIQDALPARHIRSNQTRLTFTEESWAEFNREIDAIQDRGIELQRVGWYHSHPGMGIFLSQWDLDVCLEFRRPTQVALVIDPIEPKGGVFVQGTEGFRTHSPQGFWEIKDLEPGSVVRWRGLAPLLELPSTVLSWTAPGEAPAPKLPAAPAPPPPAAQTETSAPTPKLPQQHTSPPGSFLRHRPLAATAVVAGLLISAAWCRGESDDAWRYKSEQALDQQQGELVRLSGEVESLRQAVEALQRPVEPPASEAAPVPVVQDPKPTGEAPAPRPRPRSTGRPTDTPPRGESPAAQGTVKSTGTPAAETPAEAPPPPQSKTPAPSPAATPPENPSETPSPPEDSDPPEMDVP